LEKIESIRFRDKSKLKISYPIYTKTPLDSHISDRHKWSRTRRKITTRRTKLSYPYVFFLVQNSLKSESNKITLSIDDFWDMYLSESLVIEKMCDSFLGESKLKDIKHLQSFPFCWTQEQYNPDEIFFLSASIDQSSYMISSVGSDKAIAFLEENLLIKQIVEETLREIKLAMKEFDWNYEIKLNLLLDPDDAQPITMLQILTTNQNYEIQKKLKKELRAILTETVQRNSSSNEEYISIRSRITVMIRRGE